MSFFSAKTDMVNASQLHSAIRKYHGLQPEGNLIWRCWYVDIYKLECDSWGGRDTLGRPTLNSKQPRILPKRTNAINLYRVQWESSPKQPGNQPPHCYRSRLESIPILGEVENSSLTVRLFKSQAMRTGNGRIPKLRKRRWFLFFPPRQPQPQHNLQHGREPRTMIISGSLSEEIWYARRYFMDFADCTGNLGHINCGKHCLTQTFVFLVEFPVWSSDSFGKPRLQSSSALGGSTTMAFLYKASAGRQVKHVLQCC